MRCAGCRQPEEWATSEGENEFTDMATQSPWQKMLGIELSPVSHRERLVSALGGFVGIFAVTGSARSRWAAPAHRSHAVDGSTAPCCSPCRTAHCRSPGRCSAALGVGPDRIACLLYVPDPMLAASLATAWRSAPCTTCVASIARGAPRWPPRWATRRCSHGFRFRGRPAAAQRPDHPGHWCRLQRLFPWRLYPAALVRRSMAPARPPPVTSHFARDFVFALSQMDSSSIFRGRPAAHLQPGYRTPSRSSGRVAAGSGINPLRRLEGEKSDLR